MSDYECICAPPLPPAILHMLMDRQTVFIYFSYTIAFCDGGGDAEEEEKEERWIIVCEVGIDVNLRFQNNVVKLLVTFTRSSFIISIIG